MPDTILNTCINRLNPHNNSIRYYCYCPHLTNEETGRGEDKGLNPGSLVQRFQKFKVGRHVSESSRRRTSQKQTMVCLAETQKSPPRLSFKAHSTEDGIYQFTRF